MVEADNETVLPGVWKRPAQSHPLKVRGGRVEEIIVLSDPNNFDVALRSATHTAEAAGEYVSEYFRKRSSDSVHCYNRYDTIFPRLARGVHSVNDRDSQLFQLQVASLVIVVLLRERFLQGSAKLLIIAILYCPFSSSVSSLGLIR
jgi:hypothetical protein